eukprot:scpid85525/ scgid26651/ 
MTVASSLYQLFKCSAPVQLLRFTATASQHHGKLATHHCIPATVSLGSYYQRSNGGTTAWHFKFTAAPVDGDVPSVNSIGYCPPYSCVLAGLRTWQLNHSTPTR